MPTWAWSAATITVPAIIGVLLFIIARLTTLRDALDKQVQALDVRLARQEERMLAQAPYFAGIQAHVIDLLHHPHAEAAEMDNLLDKLKDLTITEVERVSLHTMLTVLAAEPKADPVQRHGAATLLAIMPLVREEAIRDPVGSARVAALPIHPTDIPLMTDPRAQAVVRKQVAQAMEKLVGIQIEEHDQTDRIIAQLKESLHIPVTTRPGAPTMDELAGTTNAPYQHSRASDR